MTPTTPSPISDQAAGELLPCPFCGSESKSDNGFSPCESITYAWCSNQDCSLCTIEFGFTVEEWNRRAEPSPKQESGPCQICNGSGVDGGRMHTDGRGASEYEPYRCELCDGFGRSTAPTTGSAPEQRNLEGLREQILAPRGIARDAAGWPVHKGARDSSGWLYHPAIPVCDEGTRVDKLLEAFGIETSFVSMESDASDFYDRWGEEGLCDCSSWVPTPPIGDGWLLLEIYDTEDGPCALFGRDWYEAEKVRKQAERAERRAALLAASMGGDKS